MSTAPKDRPIVGLCRHDADIYVLDSGLLTTYGAHAEGLDYADDGPHVIVWGGENEYFDGGHIPAWWFLQYSNWETVANPIAWLSIPDYEALLNEPVPEAE
ncbi:hypothetical protein G3T16_18795 [Kineobactrum salinum]|uniref:Uncharacterized protein n=2 Tax=Kineobactrum salinum TaxID=2708301 RepID=A0A6C0U6W3_9GAMM|nr:hypothetical protein G3T16_18795 [Kineobactrum salinum]